MANGSANHTPARRAAVKLAQALDGLGYFSEWRGATTDGEHAYQGAASQIEAQLADDEARRVLAMLRAWQGNFRRLQGDVVGAEQLLRQSLALPPIALLLAEQGHQARAVELYALAWRHPLLANAQCFIDSFGQRLDAVVAALSPSIAGAAQARGRLLDLWETTAALHAELRARGWGQDG